MYFHHILILVFIKIQKQKLYNFKALYENAAKYLLILNFKIYFKLNCSRLNLQKYLIRKSIIRAILAGWGAKKLGGGCVCIGIIVVFIILWIILGYLGLG
jgi:hypothetical protein